MKVLSNFLSFLMKVLSNFLSFLMKVLLILLTILGILISNLSLILFIFLLSGGFSNKTFPIFSFSTWSILGTPLLFIITGCIIILISLTLYHKYFY